MITTAIPILIYNLFIKLLNDYNSEYSTTNKITQISNNEIAGILLKYGVLTRI